MNRLLFTIFLFLPMAMNAQQKNNPVKFFSSPAVAPVKGYSQAVEIDLGSSKMILLSGQVPLDVDRKIVGIGDMGLQTAQVFENIKKIIEEAGGTMDDLIKTVIYTTDISQIPKFREARDKYINLKQPPISTLVEVKKLFREEVLIEIEATAVIKK
ncbi:RidA family protein [Pedobacter caeni]|uniref:Enamine deaminase RidA, house cleaning of reactive enamine intermediates, YjgF/YER057c/UK114 family n=1 Tax=Pedobacter caeni TaxID=288992 RepID=A0A1M5BMJ9_9SPHI|nr:RidA family protein [Pedobacter caeni]SHF43731.1 Enamine deaminase RidA, house cleaning of reactive enamine intermediates, YjgF/YER057c/UK114 family [Pedobacter caeni]